MKTIPVAELSGRALDWAVAMAQGYKPARWVKREYGRELVIAPERTFSAMLMTEDGRSLTWRCFSPTQDWAQGGVLLDHYNINLRQETLAYRTESGKKGTQHLGWVAYKTPHHYYLQPVLYRGSSKLEAVMRCLVGSTLGESVEVPDGI